MPIPQNSFFLVDGQDAHLTKLIFSCEVGDTSSPKFDEKNESKRSSTPLPKAIQKAICVSPEEVMKAK